jgi:hypothetical protein
MGKAWHLWISFVFQLEVGMLSGTSHRREQKGFMFKQLDLVPEWKQAAVSLTEEGRRWRLPCFMAF